MVGSKLRDSFLERETAGVGCRAASQKPKRVHVVTETGLSRPFQESKQRRSFRGSRSATDNDDDAMMWRHFCEHKKIVAVAGQQYTTTFVSESEDGFVAGIFRKDFAQEGNTVAELLEQVTQILGYVVEQELHSEDGDVCRATSKSISPRWSS